MFIGNLPMGGCLHPPHPTCIPDGYKTFGSLTPEEMAVVTRLSVWCGRQKKSRLAETPHA